MSTDHGITRWNKTSHKFSTKFGWDNPVGERVPREDKRIPLPHLVPQKHWAKSHNIYAKDLVQSHEGAWMLSSLCEPLWVLLVEVCDHVLLMSYIPLTFTCFLPLFHWVPWDSRWETPSKSPVWAFPLSQFGCGSLHLLFQIASGSLFDGDWNRHWSVSIAEYC